MRLALQIIGVLGLMTDVVGKTYFGDTRLSSEKLDDVIVFGVTQLSDIVAGTFNITGPLTAKKITANQLTVTGPVNIEGGLFKKVSITGPVVLKQVTADELVITGPLIVENLVAVESLELIGPFTAINSQLIKVTLTMDESTFNNCRVSDILVKQPSTPGEVQKLYISGKTQVNTVKFESGAGEIHAQGTDVKLIHVIGAKVINYSK